jgi:hypothetical protein
VDIHSLSSSSSLKASPPISQHWLLPRA